MNINLRPKKCSGQSRYGRYGSYATGGSVVGEWETWNKGSQGPPECCVLLQREKLLPAGRCCTTRIKDSRQRSEPRGLRNLPTLPGVSTIDF